MTLAELEATLKPYVISVGGTWLTVLFAQRNRKQDSTEKKEDTSYSRLMDDYKRCKEERAETDTKCRAAEIALKDCEDRFRELRTEVDYRNGELFRLGFKTPEEAFVFIRDVYKERETK